MSEPSQDSELPLLLEKIQELGEQHKYHSQWLLLQEALPRAREAQDLEAYIRLQFIAANSCNSSLTPVRQREAAVELVTLLESEDAARRIQPDLAEESYALCKHWYTACAYDNLAIATACLEGYNSEGMYGAIAEGIEKCKQTGKTQCVTCFREYAVSVSIAADDLQLAAKQAHQLAHREQDLAQHDRRVVSWKDLGWLHFTQGQPRKAIECYQRGLEVATDYHDPGDIRLSLHRSLEETWLLLGEPESYEEFCSTTPPPQQVARGEDTSADHDADRLSAVRAACRGDHGQALSLLERWCQTHDEQKNLALWLDDRSRMVATLLLDGRTDRARAVSDQTIAKAKRARDWFSLRRLRALFRPGASPNPLATVVPLPEGPFAGEASDPPLGPELAAEPATIESSSSVGASEVPEQPTPLADALPGWQERLQTSDDPPQALAELAQELLDISPGTVETDKDAWAYLVGSLWCVRSGEKPLQLWKHARLLGKRFPDKASVQGMLGEVAAAVRSRKELAPEERPGQSKVAEIFRRALELDVDHPGVYYGAGRFYAASGNLSESERCYARACRLDRSWAPSALALAEVYRNTDRSGDAVDVLDLAIRQGCQDPEVVWDAALGAFGDSRWEHTVSYLELFLTLDVDTTWANYYRAMALLELRRYEHAIEAMEAELVRNPAATFAGHTLRATCHGQLDRAEQAQHYVEAAMGLSLREIDRLNRQGLMRSFERLRLAAQGLEDVGLRERVVERMLHAGLISDEYYREIRMSPHNKVREGLTIFAVELEQRVGSSYADSPACPLWEAEWSGYVVSWYVLTDSQEEAETLALAEQRRCAELPPSLRQVVETGDGPYTDRPGVIGQSVREPLPAADG